jgi:heptosyltransferase-2
LSSLPQLQPRRVCLIKPSALGDIVQTLPVATMLRQRWPDVHLSWVVNRSLAGILENQPDLNEVIAFDRGKRGLGQVTSIISLARRLRRERFDLVIDLQGLFRSGVMTLATGAGRRVGFSNAREGARWTYTDRVEIPTRDLPALEKYRRVAAALGCEGEPPAARFGVSEAHRNWALEQLARLPRPWLAIVPGAQWETKRWPVAHFVETARRAQREFSCGVVLLGGPGECELCESIASQLSGPAVNLAEKTNLLQLAAVCQAADVILSGDTGPMHLAAAVGTPVVSLFTCTSPLRAGPRGNESRIVATQVPCASSYLKRCSSLVCFAELTPLRVWPVLAQTLDEAVSIGKSRRKIG